MKTIYLHIIIGAAALLTGACGTGTYMGTPWNLHDTEVVLRCGEVFEMPFKGGSTDYTIHNSHPHTADVMAVNSSSELYPARTEQALVFRGKSKGTSSVRVKDNKSAREVVIRLRVIDPYIALLGTEHTNPSLQDNLLAWDTNLYLSSDGRFMLTTFTDGRAIKPALITRGTYTVQTTAEGFEVTITPANLKLPPQTYKVEATGTLAQILTSWNINRSDSDLDLCAMPNTGSPGRAARYWVTPSEHLPAGMSF